MIRLSAEQRAAVAVRSGPVRVVAGAGTGKTAVIAERFRGLVRDGVDPASILVMTFTERAAAEMRARIEDRAGFGAGSAQVGTFHAVCQAWLREDGAAAGAPSGFRIINGPERWILARELMWELGDRALVGLERPDDMVTPLLKVLERLKQELIPFARLEAWSRRAADDQTGPLLEAALRLYRAYDRSCRRLRLLDFDDLLQRTVRMLEDDPRVRARYSSRHRWLMVDEYQDTNLAQERMVELLAQPHGNICVVGDDDQSIYRFRGASRASMERFEAAFPAVVTRTLTRNRRSTRHIVVAAQRLISENEGRLPKEITTSAAAGPRVEIWKCADGSSEAHAIARAIAGLVTGGADPAQVAVLVRTNAIAAPIVAALVEAGVPHRVWGGQAFYARPEVRDLIQILRVIADPSDAAALARLSPHWLEAPERVPVLVDLAAASNRGADLLEVLEQHPGTAGLAAALRQLQALVAFLGVQDLFFEAMARTGYLERLRARPGIDRDQATAAVTRFAELIAEYCDRNPDQSLGAYLRYLDLVLLSGLDEDLPAPEADAAAVSVMTIHQAKGLEFDVVFVPALVEGRLPQPPRSERIPLPPSILEPAVRGRADHVAEERRLCYVAMTRARSRLHLTWAELYEGGRPWRPSRFLADVAALGPSVVAEREISAPPAAPLEARVSVLPAAVVPAPAPRALSFSAVASYRECPRQHWYRYVLRLPFATSPEAELGSIIHSALMGAGRLRQQGAPIDAESLRAEYDRAWLEREFPDSRRAPVFREVGWGMLSGFLASGGFEEVPLLIEESFSTSIDGVELRGIIDRVDPPAAREGRKKPAHRLLDYKTGAAIPVSRLRRDLQLALYALAAREAFGFDPLELEIVYLREGRTVSVPAGEGLLNEARVALAEVAGGVAAGRFEARPERRRCRLCAYRMACPDSL